MCLFYERTRNVAAKIKMVGLEHIYISEMVLGELLYGVECSDRPSENLQAVNKFCEFVTILPMSNVWQEFARQKAFLRQKGMMIEDSDIMIGLPQLSTIWFW